MEAFAFYLLKSAAWISGFGLIYILFLRKERFFNLKRLYLLTGIVASFVFPFINIHYTVELPSPAFTAPGTTSYSYINTPDPVIHEVDWYMILAGIYISGMVIMISRFMIQWWKIRRSARNSGVRDNDNIRLVRTAEYNSSFSFFNYVFINSGVSEDEMKEIMNHELVHVNQKHWFDLLLGEIMRMIQWINPFAWIYTNLIRINHEYLADSTALRRTSDPAVYKAALLNQVFRSPVINLSNSFNCSVTKTRFEMMKNVITSPYRKLRVFLVIPVFAVIFYAFALPEYKYLPVSPEAVSEIIIEVPEPVQLIRGEVLTKDGKPLAGATITVFGTTNGAVTGTDGRFVLSNVPDNAEIVVSCKGFKTETVKAASSEMVIHMTQQTEVAGYGSSENGIKQIEVIGYGRPGGDSGITIRNYQNRLLQPVIILDGNEVDREKLSKFSPDLISSISVLKEKSAISVYGDKGKDGVILITSKKKAENEAGDKAESTADNDGPKNPLIIIDDMITDRTTLKGIDPNMIESISVLKNQTKYGEKGKDGVIIVKLKPGVQLEKNDSTSASGEKPVSQEARNGRFPQTSEKGLSGSSRTNILKFIGENTRYPAGARNSQTVGKVNIILKVAKGGIVRESRVVSEKEEIKVPSLPEVVIVGYSSVIHDELRPNENAPLPKTFNLLEKESLRVANLIGNADVPEWKERDMEFAITLNYVLR
jgi:hypothetical protein